LIRDSRRPGRAQRQPRRLRRQVPIEPPGKGVNDRCQEAPSHRQLPSRTTVRCA
jgi:hypothetical protein